MDIDRKEQDGSFLDIFDAYAQVSADVEIRAEKRRQEVHREQRKAAVDGALRQAQAVAVEAATQVVVRLNEKVRARESGSGPSAAGQVVDRYFVEDGGGLRQVSQTEYERHERAEQSAATGNCACCNNTG